MANTDQLYTSDELTNVLLEPRKGAKFASPILAPEMEHNQQAGKFAKYDPNHRAVQVTDAKLNDDVVAENGEPKVLEDEVTQTNPFFCDKHGLGGYTSIEQEGNAAAVLATRINKTRFLEDNLMLRKELRLKSAITTEMTGGDYLLTPTNKWNTYTGETAGDPIADIESGFSKIRARLGADPNFMIAGRSIIHALYNHPDVEEKGKYVRALEGDTDIMARYVADAFGIERVEVPLVPRNVATYLGDTASMADMWANIMVLAYVEEPRGLEIPYFGFMLTLIWSTQNLMATKGGYLRGRRVLELFEPKRDSTYIDVRYFYDQQITNKNAGFLFLNPLTGQS